VPGVAEHADLVAYPLPGGSSINPLLCPTSFLGHYVTQSAARVVGTAITLDAADDTFVGGTVLDSSGNASAGFIAKYLPGSTALDPSFNPGGAVPGIEAFTGGNGLDVRGVAVTSFGNVYAVGSIALSATEAASYIEVFDSSGTPRAALTLRWDTPAVGPNAFNAITTDAAGNLYVAGVASNAAFFPGGAGTIAQFDNGLGLVAAWAVYFTDAAGNPVPSANAGLAVDRGGTFALTAGSLIDATGTTCGLDEAWALPLSPVNPVYIVDQECGTDLFGSARTVNVAFTGVALVPGTIGAGYFCGTANPAGLGIYAIVAYVDTANTILIGTPFVVADGTSSFSGIAVGGNSGNIYLVGTDLNPNTGQNNAVVYVLSWDNSAQTFNQVCFAMGGSPTGSGAENGAAIALDSNELVHGVGTSTSDDASADGSRLNGPSDAWLFWPAL
jgi:hypothetical protein